MDSRVSVKPEEFFTRILPFATREALFGFKDFAPLKTGRWYLAGGTALALQVGHRVSVDLDFFTPQKKFREGALERKLFSTGEWVTTFQQEGTIYGTYKGAKISFIAYPFFIPAEKFKPFGNISVLDIRDVAVMKVIAISQRGRKRDFVDLYWYLQNCESPAEVIKRVARQYPGQKHNIPHFIKSLTYFDDAEQDPFPEIYFKANWSEIKKFFRKEATALAKSLLEL